MELEGNRNTITSSEYNYRNTGIIRSTPTWYVGFAPGGSLSTLTTPIGVTKRPPVGPTLQHSLTVVVDT